ITPWTIDNDDNNKCSGVPITIDIWVEPTVIITAENDTICNYGTINIPVNSENNTTNGIRFTWNVTDNPNVTGEEPSSGQGQDNGSSIIQTLVNNSNDAQVVPYTITPWTIDNNGINKCAGNSITVYIWIEPTAKVVTSITNDSICNDQQITYNLITPNNAIYGVTFNVEVINNYSEISGYTQSRQDLPDISIDETLNNSGDTARMIMYVVTPATITSSGTRNCIGINDTIRLWINPTPRATPVNLSSAICYGEKTQIILETPTVMTKGNIVFDYTISASGGTSIEGNFDTDTGLAAGQTLDFSYENNADTIYSVYFSIVPRNDILGCISGNTVLQQVKVHPHPLDTMYLSTPFTCEGGSAGVLTAILSRGSKPDSLIWHRPSFLGDTTVNSTYSNTEHLEIPYDGYFSVTVYDSLKCTFTAEPLFISGAKLISNIQVNGYPTGYGTTCPGASDGRMLIMEDPSSTGIPPFAFWLVHNHTDTVCVDTLWDRGVIYTVDNLSAGLYTLFIKDVNGCYNGLYPEIEIHEPPEISVTFDSHIYAGGHNVSCRGYNDGHVWVNSVSGGNPGGYKYKWFNYEGKLAGIADTLDRLDDVSAGTYYLRISDLYCEKWDSVTLTEPEGMVLSDYKLSYTVDSSYNISCNGGNDGSIDLTVTGGSGYYNFNWTDSVLFSSTSEDISNLSAGTYVCEITDENGCILRLPPLSTLPTFTLSEPQALNIEPTLSNSIAGLYNINCNGGTGSIEISVSGGSEGSFQYTWTASDGGSGLVPDQEDQMTLTAGSYNLEVTDLYGCMALFDTVLTEPSELSASFIITDITCESPGFDNGSIDLSVTGGVGPYTYLWSNGETTEDISGLTPGDYIVIISDANNCEYTDTMTISLPPEITFSTTLSDYNGFNVSCYGYSDGQIDISVTSGLAPYLFNWTGPDGFASSSEDISGLKAGQYTILITDANLCTVTGIIELTEPGKLSMNLTLSSSFAGAYNINCAGDNTGFIEVEPVNQAGAITYLWSDGSVSAERTGLAAGAYGLIITDSNGCLADTLVTLTEPDPIEISFAVTEPFCPDMPDGLIELTVTGGVIATDYTYLWSDNSTTKDISNIPAGWYWVNVSDINGCIARDSVNVEAQNEMCLIIPNAISPNGDMINDFWNIGLSELYPEIEIKIFNRWGEEIWRSAKGYPDPWDGRSRGRLLPFDSYHYIIDLHNGTRPIIGNVTIVR
ncbi:MAG: gliding motility-associated C-terminal domain-containing protein, partial [Bacteroidales bacterium]|nr:gliding motility-associated C-terminal domain-containing protein [Bacteroidales bacterium]